MIAFPRSRRATRQSMRDKRIWEAAAGWYRVRYADGAALQRVLVYLSQALGPLALRRRTDGEVTVLAIGLPVDRAASLESRQTQGFALQPVAAVAALSPAQLYAPAAALPARDCDAWIVGGALFVDSGRGGSDEPPQGNALPYGKALLAAARAAETADWHFGTPQLGEVLDPAWPGNPPLPAAGAQAFVVGYAGTSRQPVTVPGCQIVGDGKRMGPWLAQFVAANPAMDVIDCRGQLAPQLVANYDAFTISLHRPNALGFNPLAALATADLTRQRNEWWWRGMHLPPPCLAWIEAHAAVTSLAELLGLAQGSGVVGQLLQNVLQTHFAADELRLLQSDARPWEAAARTIAYLPGHTSGTRHIARALAGTLLQSGRAVLLIQPLFTGSDWRFLLSHKLAAVTGHVLSLPAMVALQPRITQLEALRAVLPGTAHEYVLGLGLDEALIVQEEEIWRIGWSVSPATGVDHPC